MSTLLQAGITAQAEVRPEAIALAFKDARLTYGALEEASNGLARLLKDAGCRRGDRVGLLMPKMPAAIVAMLGALKADASYVPLDPAGPETRLARMLELSDCRCVLAGGPVAALLRDALDAATLPERPLTGEKDRLRDRSVLGRNRPHEPNGSWLSGTLTKSILGTSLSFAMNSSPRTCQPPPSIMA